MKQRNTKQGIFFLIIAVLILGRAFDVFAFSSSIFKILLTALLVSFSLSSFPKGKYIEAIMPLAFVYIMHEQAILREFPQLNEVNSWLLIWGSLFLGIALESMFKKKSRRVKFHTDYHTYSGKRDDDFVEADFSEHEGSKKSEDTFSENVNEDFVRIESNFGDRTRYIRVDNYTDGLVEVNFGSLRVYFDQSTFNPNGARLKVDCNFAKVTLFVPKNIKVVNNVSATLGSVSDMPYGDGETKLVLEGDVNFGNLRIVYI